MSQLVWPLKRYEHIAELQELGCDALVRLHRCFVQCNLLPCFAARDYLFMSTVKEHIVGIISCVQQMQFCSDA